MYKDENAASPIAVIVVLAVVAVTLTALVIFTAVDVQKPVIGFHENGSQTALVVSNVEGPLRWNDLKVQFFDAAGTDHAGLYLELPVGKVNVGDEIPYALAPPGGSYQVRIVWEGQEIGYLLLVR